LEQYCATLLSDDITLRSSSRHYSVALKDTFISSRKVLYARFPVSACAKEQILPSERAVQVPCFVDPIVAVVIFKGLTVGVLIQCCFQVDAALIATGTDPFTQGLSLKNMTHEGDNTDMTNDMKAIQIQVTKDQKQLREKVMHLSGDAGIERMRHALSDIRTNYYQTVENGSPIGSPFAHISPSSPATLYDVDSDKRNKS
ncbi:T-complex protein 11, partial [Tanacetum coccineum]